MNGLAVLAGGFVSEFIPDWLIKVIAAFAFLYFAASTIAGDDDDEEEEGGRSKIKFAPLDVYKRQEVYQRVRPSVQPCAGMVSMFCKIPPYDVVIHYNVWGRL